MLKPILRRGLGLALFALCAVPATLPALGADAPARPDISTYKYDPTWPKLPIANNWAIGLIGGVHVDTKDHVWIYNSAKWLSPRDLGAAQNPPSGKCCLPAPPVIEFDQEGNIVQAFGRPPKAGETYDWPTDEHGLYVDYKGNVWLGGSKTRKGADGIEPDGMVLKFSPQGKFLLQIGSHGPTKGSTDTTRLSGAANVAVDAKTNEVFIADGYGNHRVIVFDADSGKFKRQWGAYGKPPTDEDIGRNDPAQPPAKQFRIVHCLRIANDGLVYVCDRLNDRVQVFKKDGTFVQEFIYRKETKGSGSVGTIAFWPDATQSAFLLNDPGNFEVHLINRADGKVLSSFGHYGAYGGEFDRNHESQLDSKGNLYVSGDQRLQRFILPK
jgi:hypothetical protein